MEHNMSIRISYRVMIRMVRHALPIVPILLNLKKDETDKFCKTSLLYRIKILLKAASLFSPFKKAIRHWFPFELDIASLMNNFVPQAADAFVRLHPLFAFRETEIGLAIKINDLNFGFLLKNGISFKTAEKLDKPLLSVSITFEDMEKLLIPENIVFLLLIRDIPWKYELLTRNEGRVIFKISNDDGSISTVTVDIKGKQVPFAMFKAGIKQLRAIARGETKPILKFLTGELVIDGDTEFAVGLQPLFG